jgi:hypothetical protein
VDSFGGCWHNSVRSYLFFSCSSYSLLVTFSCSWSCCFPRSPRSSVLSFLVFLFLSLLSFIILVPCVLYPHALLSPQDTLPGEGKIETVARYKFYLAWENSNTPDYVTEKVYHALEAGSVPSKENTFFLLLLSLLFFFFLCLLFLFLSLLYWIRFLICPFFLSSLSRSSKH